MNRLWTSCLVALAAAGPAAVADDVFPPPWRDQTNTVTAGWGFWGLAGPGPRSSPAGYYAANPGGLAEPLARSYINSEVLVQDFLFGRQSVLEVGFRSIPGTLAFGLANYLGYDDKVVYLQITYYPGGGAPLFFDVGTVPGDPPWQWMDTRPAVVGDTFMHPDGWRTAVYGFKLEPAPAFEGVGIVFTTYPAYVSQIVIDTQAICYADCNLDGVLDFFDFLCFQNAFALGDVYADCNEDGALDFFDFLCFQNAFAVGCPT
ncbi:MAG: GC-type dockerin domain-anchored protein [Phycisphaerales bacterium JB039]